MGRNVVYKYREGIIDGRENFGPIKMNKSKLKICYNAFAVWKKLSE